MKKFRQIFGFVFMIACCGFGMIVAATMTTVEHLFIAIALMVCGIFGAKVLWDD